MITKVILDNLNFHAYHGYYAEEQRVGTNFEVSLSVELKSFDSLDDNIDDTVNYETLFKIIEDEMKSTRKIIETVALHIINRVKELDNITSARVKITKVNPPIGQNDVQASVEMVY